MKRKQWIERDGNSVLETALVRDSGISPIMARLLVNRDIKSIEEARLFLNGTLDDLHDPYTMKDMDKAVERIRRAISSGERIVIYSDYDVDGLTAAVLLYKALKILGVKAGHFVPDRLVDGYGIHENAVDHLKEEYDLMVSVDCGISDFHSIQKAQDIGLDVIVTDHHAPPPLLPPAFAVLNPKRKDCLYPFPYLAGVGVAYKLAMALMETFGRAEETKELWLDLVALGTVADVVPLTGENRILVQVGLAKLQDTDNPGIRALKRVSSIKEENKIGAYEVGYLLAPRLNAASRMGQAKLGFTLMTSDDETQCAGIAGKLDSFNNQRKIIEQDILQSAGDLLTEESKSRNAILLASDKWHPGVTGIVASRLKEEHHRPVLLVSWGEHDKGKGTARSISNFPITSALARCEDLLVGYGGHDMAAGFSIRKEHWEDFQERFLKVAEEEIKEQDLMQKLFFDLEIDLGRQRACDIIGQTDGLFPFGVGNPEPVFSARGLKLNGTPRVVGNNHLKLVLRQGGSLFDAIGFRMAQYMQTLRAAVSKKEYALDVLFSLRINSWKGTRKIQLHLKDLFVY